MWRTFLRVPLLLLLASLGGCAVYDYDYDDGDWRRYRGQPYAYEVPRYRVYDDGWRSERRYYSRWAGSSAAPGPAGRGASLAQLRCASKDGACGRRRAFQSKVRTLLAHLLGTLCRYRNEEVPMSHFLSFAKGALAMFWLVALVNLAYPLGELHRPILLLSGVLVLVHAAEILLLNGRLKARPAPWLERLQVLLFGVLHLRSLG